jgi:hypothetical protein
LTSKYKQKKKIPEKWSQNKCLSQGDGSVLGEFETKYLIIDLTMNVSSSGRCMCTGRMSKKIPEN